MVPSPAAADERATAWTATAVHDNHRVGRISSDKRQKCFLAPFYAGIAESLRGNAELNQSTRDWDTLLRRKTQPWWSRRNPHLPIVCGSSQESDTKAHARKDASLLRRIVQPPPTLLGSLCGLNRPLSKPRWPHGLHLSVALMVN